VPADEKVLSEMASFELVRQLYDGLNGKIIPWTKEHGGTSNDPSVQAFVVGADGRVQARAPDTTAYQPSGFAKWLSEQSKIYERAHPRTRMAFVRAEVKEGEETCAEFTKAREADQKILLYFGREAKEGQDRAAKKQSAAAKKFEKKTLDSKSAATAAEGWTLLRFDLANPDHARFAKTLEVETAPRLLLFRPGAEEPTDLGERITPSALGYQLKKVNRGD
jgi:hypothetical protein